MGIDVQLQDEDGKILERVFDEKNLLRDLLPVSDHSLLHRPCIWIALGASHLNARKVFTFI